MINHTAAWMCRWHDGRIVVWADSIEQARLIARDHAGPTVAVSARLATTAERAEAERTTGERGVA